MQTHATPQKRKSAPLPATTEFQPTRESILSEIEKLRRSYYRIRSELDRHNSVTKPAYDTWYKQNFGELEARVLALKVDFTRKSHLLDRMNALYTWRGMTRQKAYEHANSHLQMQAERKERDDRVRADRAREEALRTARIHDARRERIKEMEKAIAEEAPTSEGAEIKTYYRKLARALHPDRLRRECPVLQSLWLETQEAYQNRDIGKLKLIWGECLLEANPEEDDLLPFDIKVVQARLRAKFHQIQKDKIRISQTCPAWNFAKRDLAQLAAEILKDLATQKADLEEAVSVLDREIKAFTREHPASYAYV